MSWNVSFFQEIGHIADAQTCQRFCNEVYYGKCQWFMYDKTVKDCKLFSSSLNDLWNDCREVGYAIEPDHKLCDEMFQYDSSNGCYVSIRTIQVHVSTFVSCSSSKFISWLLLLLCFDRTLERITVGSNSVF